MKLTFTKQEIQNLYQQTKVPRTQQEAEKVLWAIQQKYLAIDAQVELLYVRGRLLSKGGKLSEKSLEEINAYFSEAIALSKHYGHSINSKLYFVCANMKQELSKLFKDKFDKLQLTNASRQLAKEGLYAYPYNSSLTWLKSELEAK